MFVSRTIHPLGLARLPARAALVATAVASLVCYGCASVPEERAVTSAGPGADTATHEERPAAPSNPPGKETTMSTRTYTKPPAAELKARLSPLELEVTQNSATEPPFRNKFWDHHEAGLYVDIASGEPLFSSLDKFDSGTGWPSFNRAVDAPRVVEKTDVTHGMKRVEVRSKDGDSHLGHLFDDGPGPTGARYCINSASLRFIPVASLEAEGYGNYLPLFQGGAKTEGGAKTGGASSSADGAANACATPPAGEKAGCESALETAIIAGGCFWGMEELLRAIPGVLETEVGYAGGTTAKPTYNDVKKGTTGHAESVRIVFDPKKVTYGDLLEKWFFKMHDPTTSDRQGNDAGSQYRSAIFFTTPEQKKVAEEVKRKIDASGKWDASVVTQIAEAGGWTPAEGYHQDYLQKNPGGYTCHWMRD